MTVDGGKDPRVAQRLENLTTAQRALLEQRLMQRRTDVARRNTISRREVHSPSVLSNSQELLWLLSQVFDDGIAYNAPGAFHLEGTLDLEVLKRCFEALVERHEILRTTYTVIDGRPMQVIGSTAPVDLNVVDLRGQPSEEREAEAQKVLKDESRFAFDLVNGPVMRATVIQLSDNENILMLNLHHVATDGYSRSALFRDLSVFYDAFLLGEEPSLPTLPIQYADYAVWQRAWLDSGVADAQLGYWQRKLAGAPSRLDLPTDYPRPPVRSYLGDHMSMMLDMPAREGLRSAARDSDATLFVAMLALFSTLLSRYSGQDDVVIGTPFAGRNRTELESMVGYFINPLALRVDLSGDPTFSELLVRARDTTLDAFQHADVPYETVVRATNPERDLSQTPVFQAMIVYHNPAWQDDRPRFEPAGIRCTEISHEKGWAKFDVLLGISERKLGMNSTWEYSTELFKPATVNRMMEHFRTLAESAATGADRRLSQLSMLSESERAKVLVSWNGFSQAPAQPSDSIKDLFETQVKRTPDAEAVVLGEERVTFAELNRRANRIASLLRDQGVEPGKLVGILMQKSLDLVATVLGVMKAGGAYVPLDPMYPADRLEFMLADSKPDVLVTHSLVPGPLPQTDAALVTLDAPGTLDGTSEDDPSTSSNGDDLAYVIYTSGSTGQPKGVMITNRSLASVYFAYEDEYRLRELHAHLQMASPSFDVFTGDIIRSLPAGAKLVLCPMDVVLDPASVYALMVREGVDAAELVPATASMLFDYAEREDKPVDFFRFLAIGGEPWRNDKYVQFKHLLGPATRLVNSYGLTEATMDSTYFEPAPDAELPPGRFVPIGEPLPNTRVYVLDANLEPQPIGIPGELCIGGIGVARGYLNRPELTAERFAADPFSDEPDARMYRTGDLARWLADGSIEFIGRSDRQLKIRGFRIEPGEIESVLERHPRVRAAAVTDREDESGAPRLIAYLVPADACESPGPEELRAFAAEQLPGYMIPTAWVLLEELPRTPNGKVDVNALPEPQFDRAEEAGELVAARTDNERELVAIWREILGVEEIGVTDNFFALGGHSLLAVRLFAMIEDRLGARLPLASLFQSATIAELARMIDEQSGSTQKQTWASVVPMRTDGERPPFFLVDVVAGRLIGYHALVEGFPESVPLYGLHAPGVDGSRLPLSTIEGLAAHYIEEIRTVQPHGPYFFGGFCFAGVVAYEIARQLTEQGEELGMVALIDAYPRGTRAPAKSDNRRIKLEEFRDGSLMERVAWIRERLVRLRARLYFRSGYYALNVLSRTGLPAPRRPWNLVHVASSRAAKLYSPPPSSVRIDYFRPQTAPGDEPTPWHPIARGGVVLHQVVGPDMTHENVTKGNGAPTLIEYLAPALEAAMDAAADGAPVTRETNGNGVAHPVGSPNGASER
ncbi:MAG TPA: amino acid adenylation domain-containing protein [Solirubrobacteraceae bacterium]|nr:amino acid adenylation domain-containing protein [Solirubrobacteraceae bacterium]